MGGQACVALPSSEDIVLVLFCLQCKGRPPKAEIILKAVSNFSRLQKKKEKLQSFQTYRTRNVEIFWCLFERGRKKNSAILVAALLGYRL